jgi:hypothetical protein
LNIDVWSGCAIADEDGASMHLQVGQPASVPLPLYFRQPLSGISLRDSLVTFNVQWYYLDFDLGPFDVNIIN